MTVQAIENKSYIVEHMNINNICNIILWNVGALAMTVPSLLS